ncbi:hypothetical protein BH23PLA1_BH23PLA1_26560 [soil metagenome]
MNPSHPDPKPTPDPGSGAGRSWRAFANPLGVLIALAVVALIGTRPTGTEPEPESESESKPLPTLAVSVEAPEAPAVVFAPVVEPEPEPEPVPEPEPPPPPPEPDLEAIARAEAEVAAIRRELEQAEARVKAAEHALEQAADQGEADALSARQMATRLREPQDRLSRAEDEWMAIRHEHDRLRRELAELEARPRPRQALNTRQSPVARAVGGQEFHFEVRGDRVAFLDMDRLVKLVEADARLRIRMMVEAPGRPISSTVGPVGAFSMRYEIGQAPLSALDDLIRPRGATFSLLGFEIVPEQRVRGETFELALSPASDFSRVLNRLRPGSSAVTLWVYPDGFPLYRRLSAFLHDQGFTVAARPLPEGLPIRGSPDGSLSAGQ